MLKPKDLAYDGKGRLVLIKSVKENYIKAMVIEDPTDKYEMFNTLVYTNQDDLELIPKRIGGLHHLYNECPE